MGRLCGKVAIVTGGATGMGLAHVHRLLRDGASVVISDRRDELDHDIATSDEGYVYCRHDVRSQDDWNRVLDTACSRFGGVDILVNNAGVYTAGSFEEETAEVLRDVLDVNVVGAWLGIQSVVPIMASRGGGSIINISSIAAVRGMSNLSVYGCSKGALSSLTRHAAMELGQQGVRVNAILPGAIDGTGMYKRGASSEVDRKLLESTPLDCVGSPDDVSSLVAYLASDESSFITGTEQVVDGGRSI